jgi:predicted dehydrogenase
MSPAEGEHNVRVPGTLTIGIGLLGVGWMGALHTACYRRVRDHYPETPAPRLVVAADEVPERAEKALALGYAETTTDWRDVLAHPDVDAVSITSPNSMHLEMATAAAQAGKHIWAEKPLGRSPAETRAIAAAVEAAGVRSIVGLNYREAPAVQHAREIVRSGELGELRRFRGWFIGDYAADPRGALSWRFLRDQAGLGVLGDIMSHAVDLALCVVGPIRGLTAIDRTYITERPKVQMGTGTHFSVVEGGELGAVENEDHVVALVEFDGDLMGSIEASRVTVGKRCEVGFEVHGTRGSVAWDFRRMNELQLYLPLRNGDEGEATVYMGPEHPNYAPFQPGPAIAMGYDDLKVIEAHLFLDSIADGRQREPGVREMLATAEVIDAMDRSRRSRAWERVATA